MAHLEMSISGLTARRSRVRHIMEQAGVALVYLGIVATFAAVILIAFRFRLLIWLLSFWKRLFQEGRGVVKVCHQCGGRFGLVRYHYHRHPFCSRLCVERFKKRLAAAVLRRKLHGWLRRSS